jgi:5-methylcytosine-specific restriction endonuclease McrA
MAREIEEWIGRSDDAKVPPRVRLRIFERERGICHLSGRKIKTGELWDLDHKIALCNGGEHRESNLFPALKDKHREKTKADVAEKSRIYKKAAKLRVGIRLRKGRPMDGSKDSPWKKPFGGGPAIRR